MPIITFMWFDAICVILLLLAFSAGFQKGVVDTLGVTLGILSALAITVWLSPYLVYFLQSSFVQVSVWLIYLGMLIMFLVLCWALLLVIRLFWKPSKGRKNLWVGKTLGGLTLLICMVLSIAILGGILDHTSILNRDQKDNSYTYKYLRPIREQSQHLWHMISEHASQTMIDGAKVGG